MSNKYAIILKTNEFEKFPNEIDAILELVRNGIYDFVQLGVAPGTYKHLRAAVKKQFSNIKAVIHAPFFVDGVNLSDPNLLSSNLQKLADAQKFADDLGSDVIVLHPGTGDGENFLDESIRQMKILHDSRIAVENLPYHPRPQYKMHGTTPVQIKKIMDEVGCNFCFDVAHAICAIASLRLDTNSTLAEFNNLRPIIYHLSDGASSAEVDYHFHLGKGDYDFTKIFKLFSNTRIILETRKKEGDLEVCVADAQFARNLENQIKAFPPSGEGAESQGLRIKIFRRLMMTQIKAFPLEGKVVSGKHSETDTG